MISVIEKLRRELVGMKLRERVMKLRASVSTQLVVLFVCLHEGLFYIIWRQAEQNHRAHSEHHRQAYTGESGPKSGRRSPAHLTSTPLRRLDKVRSKAVITNQILMGFYFYEFCRGLAKNLLSLRMFEHYHYIDCFNIGRFRFIGRTNMIADKLIMSFAFFFTAYYHICFKTVQPFKIYVLEFLLYDHKEVALNEIQFKTRHGRIFDAPPKPRAHSVVFAGPSARQKSSQKKVANPRSRTIKLEVERLALKEMDSWHSRNPLFHLRRPLQNQADRAAGYSGQASQVKWILRPNRTSASWRVMSEITQAFFCVCVIINIVWVILVCYAIGGSILTNFGFELSYPTCVQWIWNQQRLSSAACRARVGAYSSKDNYSTCAQQIPFRHFYVAPTELATHKNIDDIPAVIKSDWDYLGKLKAYDVIRILVDCLHNIMWYLEFSFTVMSVSYTFLLISIDVVVNALEIRRILEVVLVRLHKEHCSSQLARDFVADLELNQAQGHPESGAFERGLKKFKSTERQWRTTNELELEEEIRDVQAIIADHFSMVGGYNKFITFCLFIIFAIWICYSGNLTVWIGTIRSPAVEFEFLVVEIVGTSIALIFFSCAAVTRANNIRLYKPITRAMALDTNMRTKLRWGTIMDYYSPQPHFCFTLFGSTQISWLFCLKVRLIRVRILVVANSGRFNLREKND